MRDKISPEPTEQVEEVMRLQRMTQAIKVFQQYDKQLNDYMMALTYQRSQLQSEMDSECTLAEAGGTGYGTHELRIEQLHREYDENVRAHQQALETQREWREKWAQAISPPPRPMETPSEPAKGPRDRIIAWVLPLAAAAAMALVVTLILVSRDGDPSSTTTLPQQPAGQVTQSQPHGSLTEPTQPSEVVQEQPSDPYLEARALLGLSTTTPASASHINSGTGPLSYDFKWLDANGAEIGEIGRMTLTRDEQREDGGRVTIEGSDAVGAYTMGKEAGGQNIMVQIALRIPGPDGGEPRLVWLVTESTAANTLTGTATATDGDAPAPTWHVAGTRAGK